MTDSSGLYGEKHNNDGLSLNKDSISYKKLRIFISLFLIIVFCCTFLFVFLFGNNRVISNYELSVDTSNVVYMGESANLSVVNNGKGNLERINTFFDLKNEYTFFVLNDRAVGSKVTNTIVPIQEGVGGIEIFSTYKNLNDVSKAVAKEDLNITVCPKFDSSLLLSNVLSVTKGSTYNLDIEFGEGACSNNIEYKSSDVNTMIVSDDGVIKGINIGTTELIVSNGEKSFSVPVTVTNNKMNATSLDVNYSKLQLMSGDKVRLDVNQMPAKSTSINIKCSSSDTKIATVTDGGLIEAKAPGVATISIVSGKLQKNVLVVVNDIGLDQEPAVNIALNKNVVALKKGESQRLFSVVEPDGAINRISDWSSSNTDVAVVDENGVVYAVGMGITVVTVSNGNVSKTIKVIVYE